MGTGRYLDGCGNCMKYSLFLVNLLIFLGSLAVIGFGIYILVDSSHGSKLLGTNLYTGSVCILIAAAVIVALISCFGCFGAAQEVRCMLVTYFIVVFLIFVTMLVGGILLYVFRDNMEHEMKQEMRRGLKMYNSNSEEKEAWDTIQKGFKCCGMDSYTDWEGNIPASCCKPVALGVYDTHCIADNTNLYREGCLHVWSKYLKKYAAILGGVGIAVAIIMILGMIFSCSLFCLID